MAEVDRISRGMASKDMPMGIIPARNRRRLSNVLKQNYPDFDDGIISRIASGTSDLVMCMIKGFKPGGDDNRPDRGILPLVTMLTDENTEILTFMYGPVLYDNYNLLCTDPLKLADRNGLWKSIICLSDYIVLDCPILNGDIADVCNLLDTSHIKRAVLGGGGLRGNLSGPLFPNRPVAYHEDDVDTGIHYVFAHLLRECCFEGLCNPPGGDWSGLSVVDGTGFKRWLSLPRVSGNVNGKRPDHVLEIFGALHAPVLLTIESKENSSSLEPMVGDGLKNYIKNLMNFIPSVEKQFTQGADWTISGSHVNYSDFIVISAAAYLASTAQPSLEVFRRSNCDMLFIMSPLSRGWRISMVPRTAEAAALKAFILGCLGGVHGNMRFE